MDGADGFSQTFRNPKEADMTKQDITDLASAIKKHNDISKEWDRPDDTAFDDTQLGVLADFCASQSPDFDRRQWINSVHGRSEAVVERIPRSRYRQKIATV
jgi:hypothetical protein